MGRQQYLARLALGRSPYQELDINEDVQGPAPHDGRSSGPDSLIANGDYVQQYDLKGRPTNASTGARNAEMRRAQNSVLALVGVVESHERSDRHNETRLRNVREAQREMFKLEQDSGEDLSLIIDTATGLLSWWADCVLQRFIIGLYDPQMPFAEAMTKEWHQLISGGIKGAYATILPGAVSYGIFHAATAGMDLLISKPMSLLSEFIWETRMVSGHKTQVRLDRAMRWLPTALVAAANIPLMPLYYHAMTQQLGVAPAWPPIPPLRSVLPWHLTSIHSFGWRPTYGPPMLRWLGTPALLLLVRMTFGGGENDADMPIATDCTNFQYPPISEIPERLRRPKFTRDPLGRMFYHAYWMRASVIKWCGWNIFPSTRRTEGSYATHQTVMTRHDGVTSRGAHRSTTLARIPTQYLATRIDRFLEKLMFLLLEGMVLKVIAISYLDSPLPKTAQALAAAPALYSPLGSHTLWPISAAELTCYVSKIGLSLALRASLDAVFCVGVSRLVHWRGMRDFGWGRSLRASGTIEMEKHQGP